VCLELGGLKEVLLLGESAVSCVVFVGGDSFFYRMRGSCNVGCIVI